MFDKIICNSVIRNLEFIFLSNDVSSDYFPEQLETPVYL